MKTNKEVEYDFSRNGVEDLNLTFEHVVIEGDSHLQGFTFHSLCQSGVDPFSMTKEETSRWLDRIERCAAATLRTEIRKQGKVNHVLSSGIVRDSCFPLDESAYCFTLKFVKKD